MWTLPQFLQMGGAISLSSMPCMRTYLLPKTWNYRHLSSHINFGHDGSHVAHHHMTGKDRHIGLWFLLYMAATSTYVGTIDLHWALANHGTPWHCSPPPALHGQNKG